MGSMTMGMPLAGKEASKPKPTLTSTVLVGLLTVLPAFTNIKVGPFQPEDPVLLFIFGLCLARFLYSGFVFRMTAQLGPLFKSYCLFLLVLIAFSIASVRLPFFSLEDVSFLKQPILFSLSKLIQLIAVVGGFFWLTNTFSINKKLLVGAMKAYWRIGVAIAIFSLVSFLFLVVTHSDGLPLGAYYTSPGVVRARGVFNEGGPYGIYVVSVFIIGFLRRYLTGQKLGVLNGIVLFSAFILSSSKAAFCVVIFLFLYLILSAASFFKKIGYLVLLTVSLVTAGIALNFDRQITGYIDSYQNVEQIVATRGLDFNIVVGRVSAFYIVPRMIEAHPITGIGYGNYSLMRNDPRYLGSLPTVRQVQDLPDIGFPGIAAEIGIPATIWLIALFLAPLSMGKRQASLLKVAAIFQVLAHAFAVQLTFFYPWFVSACAIAILSQEQAEEATRMSQERYLPVEVP
jgi:hypothetical protein